MENIVEKITDGVSEITSHADEAKNTIESADQVIRDAVKDNPLMAIAGALGIGYIIGRIIARR